MRLIGALALAACSVGMAIETSTSDMRPARPKRDPRTPHAGSREQQRRLRQQARLAARAETRG